MSKGKLQNYIRENNTSDVEEVKHSSWLPIPCRAKYKAAYECRRCGRVITQQKESYCPSCGAKMDGENQRKKESFEIISKEEDKSGK